ncbi:MAG: uroporphyrinogen-III synthase [Acidobacteria bacterium]|jgi:uroporphyrinogen-III synthase|nr:uroporphyrinogen-III synthase [Acidobacteriota bacterium]
MTRHVLITRNREDCKRLQELVSGCDLLIRAYPVLRFETVDDPAGWQAVLHSGALDAGPSTPARRLLLASPRAPRALVDQAHRHDADQVLTWPAEAVGPGTAGAARDAGLSVEITGPGIGEDLGRLLADRLEQPTIFLFACGKDRRRELTDTLTEAGHTVLPVVVYRMRQTPPRELPPLGPRVDAVVLTSPRAARFYLESIGGRPLTCPHWALGPTTRDAAGALGIDCRIPPRPDLESLAEELCKS